MRIRFFAKPGGRSPVEEYLKRLNAKERARVVELLAAVEQHGLAGAGVHARNIDGKLWELKVAAHRVFYVIMAGPEMVLLHAYKKQGQKAPRREVAIAICRMNEVLNG